MPRWKFIDTTVSPLSAGTRLMGWAVLCGLAAGPLLMAGCSQQEPIQTYSVPKVPRDLMLGAIIPRGEKTWFFKLVGSEKAVQQQRDAFHKFIETVQFTKNGPDDKPSWKLPDGWTEEKGTGMRYATIKLSAGKISAGDEKLELTVIPLPASPGEPEDQIIANVNRWRDQMGLMGVGSVNLYSTENPDVETKTVDMNGAKVTLVALLGRTQPTGMSNAPFAHPGGMGPPADDVHAGIAADTAPRARSSLLDYKVPEGWQPGRPSSLSEAAFVVRDGDKAVEITVTRLPASGFLPNVNRWRGQIRLEPISEGELAKIKKTVPVGPLSGEYVELLGPELASRATISRREVIFGAMAVEAGQAWFFKLKGDADLAARERERFASFLKSISFNK